MIRLLSGIHVGARFLIVGSRIGPSQTRIINVDLSVVGKEWYE